MQSRVLGRQKSIRTSNELQPHRFFCKNSQSGVIFLEESKILTGFGEFSLFHTLSDVPVDEGTFGQYFSRKNELLKYFSRILWQLQGFQVGDGLVQNRKYSLKVELWECDFLRPFHSGQNSSFMP